MVNVHYVMGKTEGAHDHGRDSPCKRTERVTTSKAVEDVENSKQVGDVAKMLTHDPALDHTVKNGVWSYTLGYKGCTPPGVELCDTMETRGVDLSPEVDGTTVESEKNVLNSPDIKRIAHLREGLMSLTKVTSHSVVTNCENKSERLAPAVVCNAYRVPAHVLVESDVDAARSILKDNPLSRSRKTLVEDPKEMSLK